ncbi:MAG: hypothetical protein Q7R90_02590 [bacterium]|nr:hypothetical protein [bacterium]
MSTPEGFGAGYKEKYPEHLKQRLSIPRNHRGEPNTELFDYTDRLEKKLEKYPWFVAVALNGSAMKGYSKSFGNSITGLQSDVDTLIFVDGNIFNPAKELPHTSLDQILAEEQASLMREGKGDSDIAHFAQFITIDVSAATMRIDTNQIESNGWMTTFGSWNLFLPAKGKNLSDYRKRFKEQLYENDNPEELIIRMADKLARADLAKVSSMMERTQGKGHVEGSPANDWGAIRTARKVMWRQRIQKIFDNIDRKK